MTSLSQQKKSDDEYDGTGSGRAASMALPIGDSSSSSTTPTPLSRRRRTPIMPERNESMLLTPPPSFETPTTTMVVSPDSISNGSSHSSSLLLNRKSSRSTLLVSLDRVAATADSTTSSAASTSSSSFASRSPSISPIQHKIKGRRLFWSSTSTTTRRRIVILLVALIVASTCITLTMTVFLMGELDDPNDKYNSQPRTQPGSIRGGEGTSTPPQHSRKSSDEEASKIGTPIPTMAAAVQQQQQPYKPRVVYYEQPKPTFDNVNKPRLLEDDPTLHAPPGQEAAPQDEYQTAQESREDDCVYMSEWQSASYPTCNVLHEVDLKAAGPDVLAHNHDNDIAFEDALKLLGSGWFRHTWQLDGGSLQESTVLKTLRLEREFYGEFYDLHRRDAVAMERLTHSPFVVDIYAFCGQSAVNELADFGQSKNVDLTNLEKFDRHLRGKDDNADVTRLKLQLATSIAMGVAHVHEIDGIGTRPSMVHYDLNPRNVAIVKGGKPKLNDFNIAEFLRINPKTNETCGFPGRLHEPWWRAPEEVVIPQEGEKLRLVDEKVDVYALGNLLFHVLTTHSPRGKMDKQKRMESVRESVVKGEPPALYQFFVESKDPAIVAMRTAMKACFEVDSQKRASAREVATMLLDALTDLQDKEELQAAKHHHRKKH